MSGVSLLTATIFMFTVPRTSDDVFIQPNGTFLFPSSEEKSYPYHNGVWKIDPPNNVSLHVHISYNVENCTDCECDKIEVIIFDIPVCCEKMWLWKSRTLLKRNAQSSTFNGFEFYEYVSVSGKYRYSTYA